MSPPRLPTQSCRSIRLTWAGNPTNRARAIAATEPRGPIYLSLPREVLAHQCRPCPPAAVRLHAAAPLAADADSIAIAADFVANARLRAVTASAWTPNGNSQCAGARYCGRRERKMSFADPEEPHPRRCSTNPALHEPMSSLSVDRIEKDLILAVNPCHPCFGKERRLQWSMGVLANATGISI